MAVGTVLQVRVAGTSHSLTVRAVPEADAVSVDGRAQVSEGAGTVTIDRIRSSLQVAVPEGSNLIVGSVSGRISIEGAVGSVAIVSETGRIRIERAAAVDVRATTGRIEIGDVAGECRVRAVSGRIQIESCGSADVSTTTGRVEIRLASGPVAVHSVSGRIEVELGGAYDVEAETVTGRIEVRLPAGVKPQVAATSDAVRQADADCLVVARSETGSVKVRS